MLLYSRPSDDAIREFLAVQRERKLSYPEVGASRHHPPGGYRIAHYRAQLGQGEETLDRAVQALRRWEMLPASWVEVFPPEARIETGETVGILAHHLGFWSLNACRIVYLVDEDGPIRRCGFAYGTLPEHVECGEERFSVEWRRSDDSVWYEILVFSRLHHALAKAAYPLSRRLQKRFASDSQRAMLGAACGAT